MTLSYRIIALVVILILSGAGVFADAVTIQSNSTAQEVRELESKRIRYLIGNDLAQLDNMLSDDLVYTHSSGLVETKAQYLDALRSGQVKYQAVDHADVQVRVYADTAVLTGRSQVKLTSRGEERSFPIRFTLVYAKQEGRWRMVAWQSTRLQTQ